jgi:hypothetical protein
MTDEECEARSRAYTLALGKSFKEIFDEVFEKNEEFQALEPVVQEMIKAIVLHNVSRHYGGFNK